MSQGPFAALFNLSENIEFPHSERLTSKELKVETCRHFSFTIPICLGSNPRISALSDLNRDLLKMLQAADGEVKDVHVDLKRDRTIVYVETANDNSTLLGTSLVTFFNERFPVAAPDQAARTLFGF